MDAQFVNRHENGNRTETALHVAFDDIHLRETAARLPFAAEFPNGGIAILPIAIAHDGGQLTRVRFEYVTCVGWKWNPCPPGSLGATIRLSERLAACIVAKVLADAALATCLLDEQPWHRRNG